MLVCTKCNTYIYCMKKRLLLLPVLLAACLLSSAQKELKLWYKQPAAVWTEALPVGNGRLGAMVFGGVQDELLQLNEATLWSGGPVKTNVNPGAKAFLPKVREALFKGDYAAAEQLDKNLQGLYSKFFTLGRPANTSRVYSTPPMVNFVVATASAMSKSR